MWKRAARDMAAPTHVPSLSTGAYYASLLSPGVSGAATLGARFDASDASSLVQTDGKTPVTLPSPPSAGSGVSGGPQPTPIPLWHSSPETGWQYALGGAPDGSTPSGGLPAYTTYGGGSPALLAGNAVWNITGFTGGNGFIPLESSAGLAIFVAFRLPSASTGVYTMWHTGNEYDQVRWDASAQTLSLLYITQGFIPKIVPIPLPSGVPLPFGNDNGPSAPPPLILSFVWTSNSTYVGINGVRVVTLDATTIPNTIDLPFMAADKDMSTVAGGTYGNGTYSGGLNGVVTWNGGAYHEIVMMNGAPTPTQIQAGEAYLASKWQSVSGTPTVCPPATNAGSSSSSTPNSGMSPLAVTGVVLLVACIVCVLTALIVRARVLRRCGGGASSRLRASGWGAASPPPPMPMWGGVPPPSVAGSRFGAPFM